MKTLFPKVSILLGAYVLLHFVSACFPICDCPKTLPFFDYSGITMISQVQTVTSNSWQLEIAPTEISYLAEASYGPQWNLFESAWACSCNWDGEDGPKFQVDKFNIYADRAFNDTLAAGVSLNPLFYLLTGGDVLKHMAVDEPVNEFRSLDVEISPIKLSLQEKPLELGVPFHFNVELIKSTGDTLRAEIGPIVFQ
jgi:hypothetical protein